MDSLSGNASESTESSAEPANVLLRAPSEEPANEPGRCRRPAGVDEPRLLLVSLAGDPQERLAARRRHGTLPDEVAVLTAGETRSAAAASGGPAPTTGPDGTTVSWATVSGPGALSEIGVKLDRCLSTWTGDDRSLELCFDSVSQLLEAAELPSVFRFLHVTVGRVRGTDAVAHYHIDPSLHSERAVSTIEDLFERVFEYDAECRSWVPA